MAEKSPKFHKVYSFEGFALNLDRASLLHDGQTVKLRPKSFETLRYLLENRGRLVTKDELIQAVWPDSFVTDDSLVQCLMDIRRALGRDSQNYIKTVPRRGYIFDADVIEQGPGATGAVYSDQVEAVRVVIEAEKEEQDKDRDEPQNQLKTATRLMHRGKLGVAIAVGVALVIGSLYLFLQRAANAPSQAWVIKPLTSLLGDEEGPTWSPDGSFIAYAHNASGDMDIFIRAAGGGDQIRLTKSTADDFLPRWSPDGRNLAFLSDRGSGTNLYLIPPLGGTERKLVETYIPYLERFDDAWSALGALPWSPDGKELLFSRLQPTGEIAIWKISLATARETQLTFPPKGSDDVLASWSFDREWIAFARRQGGLGHLWLLPGNGGEPHLLLGDQYDNGHLTWSADSRRLVFVSTRTGPMSLWEIELSSRRLRQLTTGPLDWYPVTAKNGPLAYEEFSHETDLYWTHLEGATEQRLTFLTRENFAPRFSPNGKKLVYHSNRTGNDEIWLLDLETKVEQRLTDHPDSDVLPDWSPDGREIVFLSRRAGEYRVWIMNADGRAPRGLSSQAIPLSGASCTALRMAPRWSPDGNSIGYLAPSKEDAALWVVDRNGQNARPVLYGALRFDWYRDGQHVIYSRAAPDGSGIREIGVADLKTGQTTALYRGPSSELIAARDGSAVAFMGGMSHFSQQLYVLRLSLPAAPGALPRPFGEPQQITQGQGKFHVHNGGWSPDGKGIVYTRVIDEGDLYVIENYK